MSELREVALSVGSLVDQCRHGDINFRFSSKSSAREGVIGHKKVQSSRGANYVPEYPVNRVIRSSGYEIKLSGRVDGIGYEQGRWYLDEIKTVRVVARDIPPDILDSFWLQARLYGFMIASELALDDIELRLCLYHLDTGSEEILRERWLLGDLAQLFADCVLSQLETLERRARWAAERDASLAGMPFPYAEYRPGQRDMAVAVYRALGQGEQLVMQAPTGIGKTMGTMFPALLTLEPGVRDRVFYLSAKTSTQYLAEKCARDVAAAGARIRSVTITAKEKVCFSPGEPCHPDHCQYARGYYDKIRDCIDDALSSHHQFDREVIETFARSHEVCPFELALDLSLESDLIIADYNYVFDPVVYLRRFFESGRTDSIALVDEAHNLVDRGRDMFSAEISKQSYLLLARSLKTGNETLARSCRKVNQSILNWRRSFEPRFSEDGYASAHETPEAVVSALQQFVDHAEVVLREEGGEVWREELLEVYFGALRFLRTAESFAEDYVTLGSVAGRDIKLRLYCVDPARQLGEGFARLRSAVCFSATLKPQDYFQRVLGTDQRARWYGLPSPFNPDNLKVMIAGTVDTSYRGRQQSVNDVVDIIRQTIACRDGNYLVFLPSYQYLDTVYEALIAACPELNVVRQQRNMSADDREAFLANFNHGPVCGFAVMGGIFSEGIDLKGRRLIGAVVVGVGLPQVGIERDLIKDQFGETGFEYAYQYPGITRVLQTAGRVIRSDTDRGIVCLIDRRYRESRYRSLLPEQWQPAFINSIDSLQAELTALWSAASTEGDSEDNATGNTVQVDAR